MTSLEPAAGFAVNHSFWTVLGQHRWITSNEVADHGQIRMTIRPPDGRRGSIVLSQGGWDGVDWVHASIAFADHMPSYDDLKVLHRAVFGRRRYAFQVFAPEAEHINDHQFALHLYGRADGVSPLPNFGAFGTI